MVSTAGVALLPEVPPAPVVEYSPPANDVDDELPPVVARARERMAPDEEGRVRSITIAGRLTRAERRFGAVLETPDVERPRTRGDCEGAARPCPWVSCAHHLYLDVDQVTGAIKLNFPHLDVSEMAESCALDVAAREGVTLEEIGTLLNITRERTRQVEVRGLYKIRAHSAEGLGIEPPEGD